MTRSFGAFLCGLVCLFSWTQAAAVPITNTLFGVSAEGVFYELDPLTGEASNPRSTGMGSAVGITFSPSGTLYALSSRLSVVQPAWLYTLNPLTGLAQAVGPTGLPSLTEGDIAFDFASGLLYGAYDTLENGRRLFRIDPQSGATTFLPLSPGGDPSAMAFDRYGNLHMLDTGLGRLLTIDKATGAALSSISLNLLPGPNAGMSFDPVSGTLYVADGGAGSSLLYTLNPATGILTSIGPTGVTGGLTGLAFVPEPATLLLLVFAAAATWRRRV